jgi:hypothetical protein
LQNEINQNENLLLLDDPGRVRSQIVRIVRQIQRFDFDCNLVPRYHGSDAKSILKYEHGLLYEQNLYMAILYTMQVHTAVQVSYTAVPVQPYREACLLNMKFSMFRVANPAGFFLY